MTPHGNNETCAPTSADWWRAGHNRSGSQFRETDHRGTESGDFNICLLVSLALNIKCWRLVLVNLALRLSHVHKNQMRKVSGLMIMSANLSFIPTERPGVTDINTVSLLGLLAKIKV